MRVARVLGSRGIQGLLLLGVCGGVLIVGLDRMGGAQAIGERWGLAAGFVTVPVQAIVSVSPIPGEIVAFLHTALYGYWTGAALTWLGFLMAAFLEYALVRRAGRDLAVSSVGEAPARERLPAWMQRLPSHHPAFLILGRYLPFGGHLVNATAALHGVGLLRFGWTAAIGLAPSALFISSIAVGVVSLR